MKIIIDIPKEKYDLCKKWKPSERSELQEAVANGTPLPKYHGRLMDESKITKCEQVGLIIKDGNITHCLKTDAPTIIKADNEMRGDNMIAYRYTIDDGRHGGIVFANNDDEADEKLAQFYGDDIKGSFVEIWKWEDDDYYKPIPDVYDCYGM